MKTKSSLGIQILTSLLIIFAISQTSNAQQRWYEGTGRNRNLIPMQNLFVYKTHIVPGEADNSGDMTFFAKIANDLLTFVAEDSIYRAQYELTVAVKTEQGESVGGAIKRREVTAHTFKTTNDRHIYSREKFNFQVPPGEYDLFIEILDLETNVPIRLKENIVVPHFYNGNLHVVDPLFFKEQNSTDGNDFPAIPQVFSPEDGPFRAEMILFSAEVPKQITLRQTIMDSKENIVFNQDIPIDMQSKLHTVILDLDSEFAYGQHLMKMDINIGPEYKNLESRFYIRWKGHSIAILNLTQAIETVKYAMESSAYYNLLNQTEDEQQRLLDAFWKERDPSPNTPDNELEDEYYNRVSFANQNFSSWEEGMDGWSTDRGRVYIVYGPPTNVESPSTVTTNSGRYEIWYYQIHQKRFVFLDRNGTGDYRLITEE